MHTERNDERLSVLATRNFGTEVRQSRNLSTEVSVSRRRVVDPFGSSQWVGKSKSEVRRTDLIFNTLRETDVWSVHCTSDFPSVLVYYGFDLFPQSLSSLSLWDGDVCPNPTEVPPVGSSVLFDYQFLHPKSGLRHRTWTLGSLNLTTPPA